MSNNQTNHDGSGAAFGILLGLTILLAVFFIITRPAASVNEQEAATDGEPVAQVTEEPAVEEPTTDEQPDAVTETEEPTEAPAEEPVNEEPAESAVDGDEVVERTQAILDVMMVVVYGEDGIDATPTPFFAEEAPPVIRMHTLDYGDNPEMSELDERIGGILDVMSMVVYGEDGPDVPQPTVEPVIVTPQPTPVPTEAPVEEPVDEEPATDSASGGTYTADQIAAGEQIYAATCTACHGMNAEGIPGLGKDLVNGEFSLETPDDELVAMIQAGRDFDDPLNTTGIPMPANGGNPALTTEDVYNIVAYLRELQGR